MAVLALVAVAILYLLGILRLGVVPIMLILLIFVRVKMMQHAWQGVRFTLPSGLERLLRRYY